MDGIGDLSPAQFTGLLVACATLIGLVLQIIRVIFMVIEARLPDKMTPQNHNGNGRVSALEANLSSLLDRMQAGFTELEKDLTAINTKMDSQHSAMFGSLEDKTKELHRRISELRDSFHSNTVQAAKDFVQKDDFKRIDDRVRNVEVQVQPRNGARQ